MNKPTAGNPVNKPSVAPALNSETGRKDPRVGLAQTHSEPILLQSWKEIATYLGRALRTVQRYERKLGLPVRRLGKSSGSVAAVKAEVDAWFRKTSRIGVCSSEEDSLVCPFCFGTGQLGGGSDLHNNRQKGGIDLRISEKVGVRGPAETEMAA